MSRELSAVEAVAVLRGGGIVAYPTEGVWGLGCDPMDEAAVMRLLAIKQRPVDKGLILIASRLEQLAAFVDLPVLPTERLTEVLQTWPGPHTWILPASPLAPRWITGAHDGIAVRISAHPEVVALCDAYHGALVSTSANRTGQPAPRMRAELESALLEEIGGVLTGQTGGLEQPTPIRDGRTGEVLRI